MIRCALAAMSLTLLGAAAPQPPVTTTLHLTFDGLRSSKGSLRVCVWSDGEGFPDCKKNAHIVTAVVPAAAAVVIDVGELQPGLYGVSAIHDENDNSKLDRSFIGLPTEGVAFSNDAKISFGPPKFDKVLFAVNGNAAQTMHMRYFL